MNRERRPVLVILPGVTANDERIAALSENARSTWPQARVEVPNYLSRWRGVKGVGTWLDDWSTRTHDPAADDVFVFAFILGAAALPYAPRLLVAARRLVVLRSRYQEGVPRALRRRFRYPLTSLLFGRAVADLGKAPFWPRDWSPSIPTLTLIESRPTRIAERLQVRRLTNLDLGIEEGTEVAVDHDHAYFSLDLMKTAVNWLKSP
jgi:hypothetical protein